MEFMSCVELKREMLKDPVDVDLAGASLQESMDMAREIAGEKLLDPVLISWYDRKANKWSPHVECCDKDEPVWLVYAKSRGADLAVSVNQEEFVFMFGDI
jgi:Domain of unknown function (DUF5619)